MSSHTRTHMKAYVMEGNRGVVKTVPVPKINPGQILIKSYAVALNPTDWKHIDMKMAPEGSILGCDVAGEVVEVGHHVEDIKVGDSVSAFISGGNAYWPVNGAFAEYVAINDGYWLHPTNNMIHNHQKFIPPSPLNTYEGACSTGVSLCTVGPAMEYYLKQSPFHTNSKLKDDYFLIWGGSTSLGQIAIQLAKHAGYRVIVTCSPYNNDELKKLGAEECFDYKDEFVLDKIKQYAGDNITVGYDTVTVAPSTGDVYSLLSKTKPSMLMTSLPFDKSHIQHKNPQVKGIELPFAYLAIERIKMWDGEKMMSPTGYMDTTKKFLEELSHKLEKEPTFIKHMPVSVLGDSLGRITQGLDMLREGKVAGEKLVIKLH